MRLVAHYREHSAGDIDEQAQSLSRWQQNYLQLGEGPFQGQLAEIGHAWIQVFHEHTSLATWQLRQPWPGAIWFGLSSSPASHGLSFNQQATAAHHLLICPAGGEFILRTPPDFGLFGLALDQAWLGEQLQLRVGSGLPPSWRQPAAFVLRPEDYWTLSHTLRHILLTARDPAHGPVWLDTLVGALLPRLRTWQIVMVRDGRPTAHQRRQGQLIRHARTLILDTRHPATTVDALAARLFLTRRTLQNRIHAQLDMTPLQLIQAVRLQALRRDLRNPALADVDLLALAARHGFWHGSHLGKIYARHYGESPMTTRRTACQTAAAVFIK